MTLDVLFKSIGSCIAHPTNALPELAAVDVSEANLMLASNFLDSIYGDGESRMNSRAPTPMPVSDIITTPPHPGSMGLYKSLLGLSTGTSPSRGKDAQQDNTVRPVIGFAKITRSVAKWGHVHLKQSNPSSMNPLLPRRGPSRPSALPHLPNLDDIQVVVDKNADYAIAVSMYEVYNDRIFDLLTGSIASLKAAANVRRRALLFKSTEYSPDRKVVAGLRKIVCGSLDEALLVLETGLMERRVAGTGSNAVSSRSHGFFCVEVKKRSKSGTGSWTSTTLTIVDLAGKPPAIPIPVQTPNPKTYTQPAIPGSERARTAKTAGATLAEAGKINESLMYLGQCMQMQSDNSQQHNADSSNQSSTTTKPALVPFRQCKLTELLFSNSFHAAPSSAIAHHRPQSQKAIMIVTADPRGDFNATSQILRYSALAREVTVPRIPSITSTILSAPIPAPPPHPRPTTASSTTTTLNGRETQPEDPDEIAHLTSELTILRLQLREETRRRRDAETSWARAEERTDGLEAEIREECFVEFEDRMEAEKDRWRAAWEEERERGAMHLDSKLEILTRGIGVVAEDGDVKREEEDWVLRERVEELERENELLREKVRVAERERNARTPSRKVRVLKARRWNVEGASLEGDEENVSP